jgi:GMP synthase (glutamine-hydrolysing)
VAEAVVLIHEDGEGPGLLAPALEAAGFILRTRYREVRPEDAQATLVVVMGGPMGAYEASRFLFLRDELALLRVRLAQRQPVLGICLGAQLLAAAAGARVYPGAAGLELGVSPVQLTAEAEGDPVFSQLPTGTPVAHWHADTFDPVPGATLLASTERYRQQAFRLGNSYGLQFHVELDAATFAQWVRAGATDVERAGVDAKALLERGADQLAQAESALRGLLQRLACAFQPAFSQRSTVSR